MRDEPLRIEGEMTVAALLQRWPALADVFRQRGMSCPGCAMSRFDSLDYVASAYGLRPRPWLLELKREVRRSPGRPTAPRAPARLRRRMSHDGQHH